jgi:hypothetical protein
MTTRTFLPERSTSSSGCVGPRARRAAAGPALQLGHGRHLRMERGLGAGKNIAGKLAPLFQQLAVLGRDPRSIAQILRRPASATGCSSPTRLHRSRGATMHLLEIDPVHGWAMKHSLANAAADEVSSFAFWQGQGFSRPVPYRRGAGRQRRLFDVRRLPRQGRRDQLHEQLQDALAAARSAASACGFSARSSRASPNGTRRTQCKSPPAHDWSIAGGETYDITTPIRGTSAVFEQMQTDLRSLGQQRAIQLEILAGNALGTAALRSIGLDVSLIEL